MPRDPIPLSETEQFQLQRLLDKSGQSLATARAARDKEREEELRLRARQDKLAREEARLSKRLAELRIDIDTVTAEIYKISPSGVAYRHVAGKLQEFGDRVPNLSFFNTSHDTVDRDFLLLLGSLALDMYQQSTRPKGGKSLRERMENVTVDVGRDAPGAGGPSDGRAELAAQIVQAGRRRRGEE